MSNDFKTCFIITPIGGDASDIRRQADGVITSVLKPLLIKEFSLTDIVVAHEISKSGSINNQVMNCVIDSDLVIANLTGLNPNVMYELAVRHATKKPIIHICEKGSTTLPFDIADQRTIFFENDMMGVEELTVGLRKAIKELLKDKLCSDNPIYNAKKQLSIYKELEKEGEVGDVNKFIIEKLNSLEEKITMGSNYFFEPDVSFRKPNKSVEIIIKKLGVVGRENLKNVLVSIIRKETTITPSIDFINNTKDKTVIRISGLDMLSYSYLRDLVGVVTEEIKDIVEVESLNFYQ